MGARLKIAKFSILGSPREFDAVEPGARACVLCKPPLGLQFVTIVPARQAHSCTQHRGDFLSL